MARWKRLFYYLLINVAVSACTVLVVLTLWERSHPWLSGDSLAARIRPSSTPPPIVATYQAASVEPSATPTPPVIAYEVQAGDTLGEIALQFGASVGEIMQLNRLENADSLAAGTVLYIPAAFTETPAPPEPVEATGTTRPSPVAAGARVVIVNVFGAGDLATERVRIERRGEGDLALAGWRLQDEDENVYTFPLLTLYPGGAVDLYTGPGMDSVAALYWKLDQPVWETGEIVTLVDERGNVQATYTVP